MKQTKGTLRRLSFNAACIEPEDIQAEFWRGVLAAMDSVQGIGDPCQYLIRRGIWQVKSVIRGELSKKITQICIACQCVNPAYSYRRECHICGSSVENVYRTESLEGQTDSAIDYVESAATVEVDTTRDRLELAQRHVFDILLQACSRSNSPVSEAAKLLGISRQRMHQKLSKMKAKL